MSRLLVRSVALCAAAIVIALLGDIYVPSNVTQYSFSSKKNGNAEQVTPTPEPENGYTIVSIVTETPAPTVKSVSVMMVPSKTPVATVKATVKPTPTPVKTVKPTPTLTKKPTGTPTPIPTIDRSKPWTVAPNCPVTTQNCIPCTSGSDCRYEPGKTYGFRGWACQNNNPGNIRGDNPTRNQIIIRNGGQAACGIRYDSRGGNYYVFATYSAGIGALKAYIQGINKGEHSAYTNCGNCTLKFFFEKYAPGDPNYDDYVAGYLGVPVTNTLKSVIDGGKLSQLAEAIKIHEGFITQ